MERDWGRDIARRIYRAAVAPLLPAAIDETLHMWRSLGYVPNLWRPRSFNEKVAHRKLFSKDPRFVFLADKWNVRSYVRERIGEQYLVPVYYCTEDPSTLNVTDLPCSFVIKATHDSGSTIIVRNKHEVEWDKVTSYFAERLKKPFGVHTHEWFYQQIPPRVMVEALIRDATYGDPIDYKFYVFHGIAHYIFVVQDRFGNPAARFYDSCWTPLDVTKGTRRLAPVMRKPKQLEHMIRVAEALARGFDFVRVDLYAPDDARVLFGEMTFTPAAGRDRFIPGSFDWELGKLW